MAQRHVEHFGISGFRRRPCPLRVLLLCGLLLAERSAIGDCLPAPTGLIGWWPGDGNATDIAGGNNGSLLGGATANATGENGLAFGFDGTNGYVQIPDSSSLRPTNLTLEAWVWFDSLDSAETGGSPLGEQCMIWKPQILDYPAYNLEKTRTTTGDVFSFAVSDLLGDLAQVQASTVISTGMWYHVAGVRGTDFLQIFVNGQLQGQTNVGFPQAYGNGPLYFGSTGIPGWDQKLFGRLDEVSLYNRTLSSAEVASIYAAGAAGKCKQVGFSSQPQGQTVVVGSNAFFQVSATGFGTLGYQWQFNQTNLAGASNPTLVLTDVQPPNAGDYRVVVTNLLSSTTSSVAVLTVLSPPAIVSSPQVLDLVAGTSAVLTVSASGTPPLSYQWQLNGTNTPGATGSNLVLGSVEPSSSGIYSVVVSNMAGSVTGIVATISASCPLIEIGPATLMNGAAGAAYVQFLSAIGGTSPYFFGITQGSLPPGVSLSVDGEIAGILQSPGTNSFTVGVHDANGCMGTNTYSLVVAGSVPLITQEPQSQTNIVGTSATFSVAATGLPTPTYQWQKDGQNLPIGTNSVLTISNVLSINAGNYDVTVSNSWGVTTSVVATLTVWAPPAILSQPASQTLELRPYPTCTGGACETATFTASVIGTPASSLAWRVNGTNLVTSAHIFGTSSATLTISGVQPGDAGDYTLIASNVAGMTTSTVATLTVTTSPIRDLRLEDAIRSALAKPVGPLSCSDLQKLVSLVAFDSHITELAGLECASNLSSLFLGGNYVADLSPLTNLTQLSCLVLYNNHGRLGDISPLQGLKGLSYLDLRCNPNIPDFRFLSGLTGLTNLFLGSTGFTNLGLLTNLSHLAFLDVNNNGVVDLSALGIFPALSGLDAGYNPNADFRPLGGLTNLSSLYFSGNLLTNFSALGHLTGLKGLVLANNAITDLSPLGLLTNLSSLSLAGNAITDCSALSPLAGLQSLWLYGNSLSNVSVLGSLPALKSLVLASNQLSVCPAVSPSLVSLDLGGNQVTNCAGLGGMTNLSHLALGNNRITDVSSLSTLTQLRTLDLSSNGVVDISPLVRLTNLCALNLSANPISNYSAVSSLQQLTQLYLRNDGIGDLTFLRSLGQLTVLDLLGNPATNLSPVASLSKLTSLDLSSVPAGNWGVLAGLWNLSELSVESDSIKDLGFMQSLASLTKLDLLQNDITDLTPLSGLINLEVLLAGDNLLTNLDGLGCAPRLSTLDVRMNLLPLAPGAVPMAAVQCLTSRVVSVLYEPQDRPPRIDFSTLPTKDGQPFWPVGANSSSLFHFAVSDIATPASRLNVAVTSAEPLLLPASGLVLDGTNGDRTLTLMPAPGRVGTSLVNLVVTDHAGLSTTGSVLIVVVEPERVNVPDPELASVLTTALNLPGGDITNVSLLALTQLFADGANITNLAGLEWATNLTSLDVSGNPISEVTPLRTLTGLTTLSLNGDQVSDISPLAGLTNLNRLDLSSNPVTNYAILAEMTNLTALSLAGNRITNLTFLTNLTELASLNLATNLVRDVSALAGLSNLDELFLQQNRLADVGSLTNLAKLARLDIRLNIVDLIGNPGLYALTANARLQLEFSPQREPPSIDVRTSWVIPAGVNSSLLFNVSDTGPLDESLALGISSNGPNLTCSVSPISSPNPGGAWSLAATPGTASPGSNVLSWIRLSATNDVGLTSAMTIQVAATPFLPVDGHLLGGGSLVWSNGGDVPWFGEQLIANGGGAVAESGAIGYGQHSLLQTSVFGPGRVSFWWKVSSETNTDFLKFGGGGSSFAISGEVDWEQQVVYVDFGTNVLTWTYSKNTFDSSGWDAGWLGPVVFEPGPWLEPPTVLGDGSLQLVAHNPSNAQVGLQFSSDLVNWVSLAVVTNAGFVFTNYDVPGTNSTARFYRTVAVP